VLCLYWVSLFFYNFICYWEFCS